LDALWSHAKAALIDAIAALFATERFPKPGLMLRAQARIVRQRIAALGIMVRRLIALEAAARGPGAAPRPASGPRFEAVAKTRKRIPPDVSAEDPRDWTGVSFVLVPPKRNRSRKSARTPRKPERYVDITRLAVRLEALTRAVTAPERYIAKLARRLSAAPARVETLITRPRPTAAYVTRAFDRALKAALAGAAPDTS
ncbi:MAG: hypothetical protein NW203_05490, partial [Hyphomonadaceae bacterium]|nr:hypothetical protein [Hyphomonadaceae bacterium]